MGNCRSWCDSGQKEKSFCGKAAEKRKGYWAQRAVVKQAVKVSWFDDQLSLGLMINAGTLLASSRKLIFGGPMIALGLTEKSLSTVK